MLCKMTKMFHLRHTKAYGKIGWLSRAIAPNSFGNNFINQILGTDPKEERSINIRRIFITTQNKNEQINIAMR